MTTKNNRLKYVKPAMQVYKLQGRHTMILCGSSGDRDNYVPTNVNPFAS